MPKNVWNPTESELAEMGFVMDHTRTIKRYVIGAYYDCVRCDIVHLRDGEEPLYEWDISVEMSGGGFVPLYPESRQDVETLIRLMTP